MAKVKERKLSDKQLKFIEAYLLCGVATQAYKDAGYVVKNDNLASVEGSKLLGNPRIAERIERRRQQAQKRNDVTVDWVVEQMQQLYISANKAEDYNAAG